ncbi:MAG: Rne/Rng family ribonuclease [Planctomycetota bacterium]
MTQNTTPGRDAEGSAFGAGLTVPEGTSEGRSSARTKAKSKPRKKAKKRTTRSKGDDDASPKAARPEAEVKDAPKDRGSDEAPAKPRRASRSKSAKKKTTKRAPAAAEAEADAEAPAEKPKRKRAPRKRSSSKARSDEAEAPEPVAEKKPRRRSADAPDDAPDRDDRDEQAEDTKPRTRKARRSRKKASGSRAAEEAPVSEVDEPAGDGDEASGDGAKRKRRRGKRGGRRHRGKKTSEAVEIEVIPGEEDELPELLDLPDDAELVQSGEESGGKRKRKSRGKSSKRDSADEPEGDGKRKRSRRKSSKKSEDKPAKEAPRTGVILVNARYTDETRVAVVEDGRIVDLQMTVKRYSSYVNDIYRGRVVNLESAIGAAFVDFGQGRNGFLHASDVLAAYGEKDWSLDKLLTTQIDAEDWEGDDAPDDEDGDAEEDGDDADEPAKGKKGKKGRGRSKKAGKKAPKKASKRAAGRGRKGRPRRPRLPIEKLLQKGQMSVVQITKDAIGDKGPTLTTYISIPGRYLVLMPSLARTGVSRKIEDDKERRRLKRILQALDIPAGMGVIVRTAGVGKTKADIKRDLEYLLLAWEDFSRRLVSGRNPAPLYQESDVSVRTMRDLFSNTTDKVVVDDEEVYRRMVDFTEKLMPENVDRIVLHDGPRPIFHAYGVEQDFEKIFQRRVELPSGGSIVMDQTEALVAIDVNSGRTRDEGADFEDIALKTNLEAAPEIARQIRLRDMGGIIVVDFIDMMRMANRRAVERAFRDALALDRARSKVGRISQFGLLELTRQRLGPGLSKLIYDNCSVCRGTGRRRSAASRAQAILRRLGTALTMKGFSRVEVRAHPDAIQLLRRDNAGDVERLRESSGREVVLSEVPDQVEDSVLRYLRADGREVRPGGRKKR